MKEIIVKFFSCLVDKVKLLWKYLWDNAYVLTEQKKPPPKASAEILLRKGLDMLFERVKTLLSEGGNCVEGSLVINTDPLPCSVPQSYSKRKRRRSKKR